MTLIKEDGSRVAGANSYATVADADAYHAGHVYASAWTAASREQNAAALVMATRVIDSQFQFRGRKVSDDQALQWPRQDCPDPDSPEVNGTVDEDVVPQTVVDATCELARLLLAQDLTADPSDPGLKSVRLEGTLRVDWDVRRRVAQIPAYVRTMLMRFGEYLGPRAAVVRLTRV
jgi:hypothetical protein